MVVPATPAEAKGLLLASIADANPVIFFEPKLIYRSAIEEVPTGYYEIPLGKARIVQSGTDVTSMHTPLLKIVALTSVVVGWGAQIHVLQKAVNKAKEDGISCELIDLRMVDT